ncbi:hypothetical protein J2D69_19715 [Lysinibacillus sphaericus]|uniref:Uncharacterized protein n=2 Tax=Lysinibacillus TaxID=400634 RepID=W7S1S3_LYSSH|nr:MULTISPECIES: hypothetical protein [Lysinibacillus]MBE5084290.1 hypothetical protein [Bacillus thuringiensis]AMO32198.1 hypothetical protein AR327_06835 [Lysinibacillus sphaericus]AMR92703.1 hypothetical protein A1T07_22375 [Lysinibacillus sphaericus]ANA46753.1 hypothetical protein A2J09_15040 [Lysinibacillus sphaericus]EWH30668.1 hypothetical protein P799_23930 [Lysinibacillus sphaericus CBAM5]
MKKGKLFASILATTTFLFSGAIMPSAEASQVKITPSTSTVENTITPYSSTYTLRLKMEWAGRYPSPSYINHNSSLGSGILYLQTSYYDANTNMTIAWYEGLVTKP